MLPRDAGLPDPRELPPAGRDGPGPVIGRVEPLHAQRPGTMPPTPPGLSATPDLFALLTGLRRRWASWVLIGTPLGVLVAIGVWVLLTPEATALTRLRVQYTQEGVFGTGKPTTPHDFKTHLQTRALEIKSTPVLRAALKRDEVRRLNLEAFTSDPMAYLEEKDRVKVEVKDNSELVDILVSSSDPTIASTVANAIKEAYMDTIVYNEEGRRVANFNKLEKSFNESSEALKAKRKSLQTLRDSMGTNDPALWQQQRQEALLTLRDARVQQAQIGYKLVEARASLEAVELRIKAGEKAGGGNGLGRKPTPAEIDLALDADGELRQLKTRLKKLQTVLDQFPGGASSTFPSALATRDRIAQVKGEIADRRKEVIARVEQTLANPTNVLTPREDLPLMHVGLFQQVKALTQLDKDLRDQVKGLTALVSKSPTIADDYVALTEEIRQAEKLLEQLGERVERERLEQKAGQRITRFQDAELVRKDNKKQVLATLAAPLAIFFAVGLALAFLDFRQRRIRTAGQISRGLGIRVVGAVPEMPGLEKQLVGPDGDSALAGHPVLESLDAIRTYLMHEADARQTRVVLVTSATAGEGKTTLASHLASSLARAGKRALLLDGDLRRPTVHELFEVPMQPGFSEALLGEVEVQDGYQMTGVRDLFVMPAGQWDREVLQALSTGALEAVLDRLQQDFDFIVIDSHPVLAAADSLLLGRHVDAVLLSVLREVSQMPKVYAAAQRLGAFDIRVLGAVVSGTDPEEVFANAPATVATPA